MADDRYLEIEKLKLEAIKYQEDARSARQQRWVTIAGTALAAITPILLTYYHAETVSKVNAVKTSVAEEAATVKTSTEKAVEQAENNAAYVSKVGEKVDANLLQWKAYISKEPEDVKQAATALAKTDPMQTTVAESKQDRSNP